MPQSDQKIQVLDHGFVRLVDHMGSDLSIVRAARVSYDADWRTGTDQGSDEKLIRYLWRNKHTSPFEAVQFTFEVKAPIFVFRQWHRHRTWSYNELSARYAKLDEDYYVPDPLFVGKQSKSNKQARVITNEEDYDAVAIINNSCEVSFNMYFALRESGVPREVARTVLPLATYSRMFASVNLLNLFKFLTLRGHKHAQYEIRQYAAALIRLIRPIVPVATSVWEETFIEGIKEMNPLELPPEERRRFYLKEAARLRDQGCALLRQAYAYEKLAEKDQEK